MTKIASLVLAMMVGLLTCGQRQNNPEVFTVQLLCNSPELYRIDYVASLDGEYLCQGGIANFDKIPLNNDPYLFVYFSQEDLEGQAEGKLSLELHLYDEKEDREIAILDPIEMDARLGAKHIVQVTGSKEEGYTAGLAAVRPTGER